MDKVVSTVSWAVNNGPFLISTIVGVLTALIAFFMVIPGEQPEKALKGIADFLSKFSAKPKQ